MILVDPIIRLIKLAVLSGSLKDEQPISVILVSKPEGGKTLILSKFSHLSNVAYMTDLTAYGIITDLIDKIDKGEITHIMIPDLIKPLSRKADTVKNLITFFNALIEEGFVDMSIYYKRYTGKHKKRKVRCGLITAITKEELFDKRHKWIQTGFMSRPLPCSFAYSPLSQQKIRDYIKHGKHVGELQEQIKIPATKQKVTLSYKFASIVEPYVVNLALAQNLYGFRYQRQFQALLKASALEDKRSKVTDKDVKKLLPLLDWINLDFKVI